MTYWVLILIHCAYLCAVRSYFNMHAHTICKVHLSMSSVYIVLIRQELSNQYIGVFSSSSPIATLHAWSATLHGARR